MKKITLAGLVLLATPTASWAAETAALPSGEGVFTFFKAALALGCGLGIAIAAFGGALAQGRAAAAALEGIARNPEAAGKVMTPMIIALALIESLVIYALVISFMLMGKI
ncbi:MAG: ATP synthase F0 subunit C [Deltaproteobacteria bacterium RIFCSPLOWO2_02_FULL_46_8]|nr:MAG: ATP synthase F0 subunit C [Deltaproteobacteria bacterium RIFCSPLOWO2_02_FULL_46_8]